ncbi:Metallo-dependent hydrolase [Lasiodiplodia theobromae]|uniref:Cytosine deaminase n=1 Tax=Lasiodiplodia theobromae TaxID=45133 RepID=A0A5N5DQS8_9PEZI|nr:Metallo-dependent hydrolase [Lasiodiplodia theobromae]KAB2580123.1 Cytosine deaminase [Lasiodiplodia theobromae]KAF4541215.1 Metallo-dependent hydrolase [Lasiodiplodia theobromae]
MAGAYLASLGIDLDAEMAKIQFSDEKSADHGIASTDAKAPHSKSHQPPPRYSDVFAPKTISRITAARLPGLPASELWDVSIADGRISSVEKHDPHAPRLSHVPSVLDAQERLVAPSLCHAHIHLDKCFLLQDPKYSDLEIVDGSFQEAMDLTSRAKSRFEEKDLLRRGRQLIKESIQHGVTAMRAFVEVDADVEFKCLDAGLRLKEEFANKCDVQICAFAQLPLFSGVDGGEVVRKLMMAAAKTRGVDVLGSTPYVESDEIKMKMNVRWISSLALAQDKFLDFHMDYNLDKSTKPFIWTALELIKERCWENRKGKLITMGHCTRLTYFQADDWKKLKAAIGNLPVSFVGLPTSDLFMMRTTENVRGTLHVPKMIQEHGLQAAIAVNNVGNAFTPQGNCDPLAVASMGVGVYQAATRKDAEVLYECVSNRAKAAIGLNAPSLSLKPGDPADLVIFDGASVGWRSRKSVAEAIYDPGNMRTTVKGGRITTN